MTMARKFAEDDDECSTRSAFRRNYRSLYHNRARQPIAPKTQFRSLGAVNWTASLSDGCLFVCIKQTLCASNELMFSQTKLQRRALEPLKSNLVVSREWCVRAHHLGNYFAGCECKLPYKCNLARLFNGSNEMGLQLNSDCSNSPLDGAGDCAKRTATFFLARLSGPVIMQLKTTKRRLKWEFYTLDRSQFSIEFSLLIVRTHSSYSFSPENDKRLLPLKHCAKR